MIINEEERIDKLLKKIFPWFSRNFFEKLIENWYVLVNNKIVKKSYKTKIWDKLEIINWNKFKDNEILKELPYVDLKIILEKEDYLVLYKPKGIITHPVNFLDFSNPSVLSFILNKYNNNLIRWWIIHRLDKDTDWFLIVWKTQKWINYFRELFDKKSNLENVNLRKFYRAICEKTDKWINFLKSIKIPYIIEMEIKPKIPYYKPKLWISIIYNYEINTNINIYIEPITWRTHQIRYQLSNIWIPIIGDYLYWNWWDKLQLTNYRIIFEDLYWEIIDLSI